jgi:hypothetical protein
MRVVGMAAVTALIGMALTMPAQAQMGGGASGGGSEGPHMNLLADQPSKSPEQIEADEAKEKAYKESLKKIPDAKGGNDPWGVVRSEAPKSAATKSTSAAKPKTKTGSNTPN